MNGFQLRMAIPAGGLPGILACLVLAGCATAPKPNYEYAESMDPALYSTFWVSELQKLDQQAQFRIGPTVDQRVHRAAVDGFLEKGMIKAEKLEADLHVYLLISLQIANNVEKELHDFQLKEGVYRPVTVKTGGPRANAGEYHVGTFFIDIVDRQTGELIWRGWLDKDYFRDPSRVDSDQVAVAIRDLLRDYPPPAAEG